MVDGSRPATVDDIHEIAMAMPGVTRNGERGKTNPTVYQVSRRSFIFFRNPRPDAVDAETGERYDDVIVFWVDGELEKEAILSDSSLPFFTTPHFDGHPSVLLRASHNQVFRRLSGAIHAALKFALHASNLAMPDHREAIALHGKVVEALRLRDAAGARDCVNQILDLAKRDLTAAGRTK